LQLIAKPARLTILTAKTEKRDARYENEGTEAQMKIWVEYADKQLLDLAEQRKQLDETMDELKRLRDLTAQQLS